MLSLMLNRASRSVRARRAVESLPLTRKVVDRFVAGDDIPSALDAVAKLSASGMGTSLDVLGEDVTDLGGAQRTRDAYLQLLDGMASRKLTGNSEVSLKLSALGQAVARGGEEHALKLAREICAAASAIGSLVTLDMEDHTTVDSTLAIGAELRRDFPQTGNVLQSNLMRTEADLVNLSGSGARIRLVKGAYKEPSRVAYQRKAEVDAAYARGIGLLAESTCRPMIATHDPGMIRLAEQAMSRAGRAAGDWEVQMLLGIRADLQRELTSRGRSVRVYIPFGTDWYGYFMRRLAERPANVAFFLRALAQN
jgi:proline dehydrogenase